MTEEKEDCKSCKVAVGLGMYLNVCKVIDSKEKCEELFEKVTNDELEPEVPLYVYYQKHRFVQPKIKQFIKMIHIN